MSAHSVNATTPLHAIAAIIRADWSTRGAGIYFGAKPYIEALATLNTIHDMHFDDDAYEVVARFLANASTWRGPIAREVKSELRNRLRTPRK